LSGESKKPTTSINTREGLRKVWDGLTHLARPAVYLLSHNLISRVGVVITTTAAVTLIIAYGFQAFGYARNPYAGILIFLILPGFFVLGLILIPIGILRQFRRERRLGTLPTEYPTVDFAHREVRRTALFVAVMTAINIPIFAVASYRGTVHMESVQFCGQTCHRVMEPEFTAYQRSPHSRVACVECHIGPGAPWFVRSKLSGSYQVIATTFNLYPRPIPTPIANLRPALETCEQCHWPQKFTGDRFVVKTKFADDEQNSPAKTVLLMHIGGVNPNQELVGIHGRHLGRDSQGVTTYIAADPQRQVISWVSYENEDGTVTEYASSENPPTPELLARGERRQMDCMDCHNRPTHAFDLPEDAVDRALAGGRISTALPFIKKLSVELLRREYPSKLAAQTQLPEAMREFYRENHFAVFNAQRAQIEQAAAVVLEIYNGNIFPQMNITWGTYANNLGHSNFPGCFRCHDGSHVSSGEKVINQDCNSCHTLLAMEEPDPEILRVLSGGS
jgi:hypothetical protein